jgi:hypothetical protein
VAAITFSDVLTDQRVSEILNAEWLRLAKDPNALPNHPAIRYAKDFAGAGTLTLKIPAVGFMGYDLPDQIAEGADVPDSTITDSQVTLTVARYSKAYSPTDVVKYTDSLGIFNAASFAQDAMQSHVLKLTDLIANVVDGFNATAGTTTQNLSIATVAGAIATLEANAHQSIPVGMALGLLHPDQWGDFRTDLISNAGGALQYHVPAEKLRVMGLGYAGEFLGIDWIVSDYVPTANAGADRAGAIWLPGAVLWGDMSQYADSADSVVLGNKILFERDRNARGATTSFISHSYLGATLGIDSSALSHRLGITLISDLN